MDTIIQVIIFIGVLLLVLVGLAVASLAGQWVLNRYKKTTTPKVIVGGSPSRATDQVYDKILPYVVEIGDSSHIETYLSKLLDLPKVKISEYTKSLPLRYPKLYELLLHGAIHTGAESDSELMTLLDIKYLWFVPSSKRALLLNSQQYDLGISSQIRDAIKSEVPTFHATEVDKLTSKLNLISRGYYKFKSNFARKNASVITKAKANAYELDTIGFAAPLKYLIGCVKYNVGATKSIDDKLREIDLMSMYPKDPLAVRRFIERVGRDIRDLERFDSRHSLTADLGGLIFERERIKAQERERAIQERERALTRERDDLQRAIAESKLTAREEELARKEKELNRPPPQISQLTNKPVSERWVIPEWKPPGEKRRALSEPMF